MHVVLKLFLNETTMGFDLDWYFIKDFIKVKTVIKSSLALRILCYLKRKLVIPLVALNLITSWNVWWWWIVIVVILGNMHLRSSLWINLIHFLCQILFLDFNLRYETCLLLRRNWYCLFSISNFSFYFQSVFLGIFGNWNVFLFHIFIHIENSKHFE